MAIPSMLKKDVPVRTDSKSKMLKKMKENWELYLLMSIPFLYIIIFHYLPMFGLQIAFKNYSVVKGIFGSKWVGLVHFNRFFHSYQFVLLLKNTIVLSLYNLLAGFPFPIILAISLNYLKNERFKKATQMVTYAPHFISVVVIAGLITQLFSVRTGFVNNLIELIGGQRVNFLGTPGYFKSIYVWSSVWQEAGWGSIIYLAALAGIDPQLHEAAMMDGASKLRRIWHIDLPGITPTIVILLIMNVGKIMNVGFQKVLLLQNPLNMEASDIIDTYVYTMGIASGLPNFSYVTAIGLFKSLISFALIIGANYAAKKLNDTSLW